MNNEIKPGVRTSEMYTMLIATGVALALAYGLVSEEEAARWTDFLIALIPLIPGVVYIISRTVLKIKTSK
jgi:hypothetical protein